MYRLPQPRNRTIERAKADGYLPLVAILLSNRHASLLVGYGTAVAATHAGRRRRAQSYVSSTRQLPFDHADPRRYPEDMQVTRLVLYRAMASHSRLLESLTGARSSSTWWWGVLVGRWQDAPYPAHQVSHAKYTLNFPLAIKVP